MSSGENPKRFIRLTPIDDPAAFGPRLRAARLAAGLSLRGLAFPGCTPAYISRLENGSRLPSLQLVHALAERLSIRPEALLGGSPRPSLEDRLLEAELALRLGEPQIARDAFDEVAAATGGELRARALGGLAQLLSQEGEAEEAISLLEEARSLLGKRFVALPSLVLSLGVLRAMRSEFEEALALFEAGRRAAEDRGDRATSLRFTLMIANSYIDLGALPESAAQLSTALGQAETIDDLDLRARTLWSQSRLHTVEGRYEQAAELARRALAVLEVAEDDLAIARIKHVLAYIELERGNPRTALDLIDEGLPLVEHAGDADELALFRLEQARAYVQLGDLDAAREIAVEISPALVKARRGDAGRCFTTLGDVWAALGAPEQAISMYDAAIETLADHRNPHLVRAYKQKAALLETLGDRDGALELLKRAVDPELAQHPHVHAHRAEDERAPLTD
jgi:tetratricopeptide (TPR) repeat protein